MKTNHPLYYMFINLRGLLSAQNKILFITGMFRVNNLTRLELGRPLEAVL